MRFGSENPEGTHSPHDNNEAYGDVPFIPEGLVQASLEGTIGDNEPPGEVLGRWEEKNFGDRGDGEINDDPTERIRLFQ